MSDVSSNSNEVPGGIPIPADPPVFSVAPASPTVAGLVQDAPAAQVAPAVVTPVGTVQSTQPGTAGLDQYAGDLGQSLATFVPAKLRAVLYPLGYLASGTAVVLGMQHIIDFSAAILIAGAVQAFTTGLALSNVPKGK